MATKLKSLFTILFVLLLAASCSSDIIYSEYKPIPHEGWNADSIVPFTFEITDSIGHYDIIISVRHTQQYAYQNMWLFVNGITPTGQPTDSIEFFVADNRGKWLGNGWGDLREMPVLYMQDVVFPRTGEYHIGIQQGMREEYLKAVNDIGVIIQKSEQ